MGVKLDDVIGNKNDDILVDKSKRTIDFLMAAIAVMVVLIAIVTFVIIRNNAQRSHLEEIRKIISDTNTISSAVLNLTPDQYVGQAQDDTKVYQPVTLEINKQAVEYKYGYYYVTSSEIQSIVSALNLKDKDYIIKYETGEVISISPVLYKGKKYYDIDDFIAIEKLIDGDKSNDSGVYIPSDYTTFIREPKDMLKMHDHPDYLYKLTADIDMSELYGDEGDGWKPVNGFSGLFDGRGYTISNLYINRNDSFGNCGLFGTVSSEGIVNNLKLEDVNISGGDYTGGIAGSFAGTAVNCSVTGTVNGGSCVGGAFGNFTGNANKIVCQTSVNGIRDNVGGFAGVVTTGKISQVAVRNAVITNIKENTGGLFGLLTSQNNITIEQSLVKDCKIKAPRNVGGFVGNITGLDSSTGVTLSNSYANRVSIEDGCYENIGGFAGVIDTNGKSDISLGRVYSTTAISKARGITNRGGFVGKYVQSSSDGYKSGQYNQSAKTNIQFCYWQKESLDEIDSVGNYDDISTIGQSVFSALTADQIRSVEQYRGWVQGDLNLWVFDGRNPPTLTWER